MEATQKVLLNHFIENKKQDKYYSKGKTSSSYVKVKCLVASQSTKAKRIHAEAQRRPRHTCKPKEKTNAIHN